jgi:hypothetical protein
MFFEALGTAVNREGQAIGEYDYGSILGTMDLGLRHGVTFPVGLAFLSLPRSIIARMEVPAESDFQASSQAGLGHGAGIID